MVGSGIFRIRVGVSSRSGFYLKEIRYGDKVSTDGIVALIDGGGDVVLVLSTRGGRLTGKVNQRSPEQNKTDSARQQVVLIPEGAQDEAKLGVLDQTAVFSFQDLAPGVYQLYAFEGVAAGAWEDAEFRKEVAGMGIEVRMAAGKVKNADVTLRSRAELGAVSRKLGME